MQEITGQNTTGPTMVGQIELRPIDQLFTYAANARVHSEAQVSQIAASIREFGFTNPILIGTDSVIIAGHARLMAARQIGMTTVPVIVLAHLSTQQRRALVIADNQLALNASWDEDKLQAELAALRDENFDLELLGLEGEDLARLLAAQAGEEGLTEPDAVPAPAKVIVTCVGDVWEMGEHRLLCGDATDSEAVRAIMGGGGADMVFMDPPFSVAYQGKTARKLTMVNDDLGAGFHDFLRAACANIVAVCDGGIYICMSSSELHTLYHAFTEAGGHWSTFVIWAKHHFTLGRSDYQRQYEPILYGWREGEKHAWYGGRDQGDVFFVKRPMANPDHPTMKPVELVERAVENSSKIGDTVLDAFAGSGTTMIACQRLQRKARLIEIDPKYADVICRRWEQYSGQSAVLQGDGRCFDVIAQERQKKAA